MTQPTTVTLAGQLLTEPSRRPREITISVVDLTTGSSVRTTLPLSDTLTFVIAAILPDSRGGRGGLQHVRCDDPQGLAAGLAVGSMVQFTGTLHGERLTRRGRSRTYHILTLDDLVPLDHLAVA